MKSEALRLLEKLTQAHSVPGHEDEVRAIFTEELKEHGELGNDRMGSLFCRKKAAHDSAAPKILVAGHMDEVGFRIQHILPDGFLKIVPLGGWWGHNLLSQRVEIKTAQGEKITGVVASKPPHFLAKAERNKVQQISEMFIDTGAATHQEAADWGIQVGDPVAPVSPWTRMRAEDQYLTKSFDNRVGMAAAIQSGREAPGDLPCELITAGTVQEEVGLRGAKTLAAALQPDIALVLEGPPADDTPGLPAHESQGALGRGVQIRLQDPSGIMNPRLARFAIDTARENKIPHQVTVRAGGGTDAGSFNVANEGIPSLVLGTPARYIHSHNGIININDQVAMLALLQAMLKKLSPDTVKQFTKYI